MGSKGSSTPSPVTPQQSAQDVLDAQLNTLPRAAQLMYNIQANPEYGLEANTRLQENARRNIYGLETQAKDQALNNLLQNLISPTGISPEQQAALDSRRALAQDQLVKSMRERANLGGGLYGGNSIQNESRAVGELQSGFAESDIAREERARLNALQGLVPYLQMLYPQANISPANFISPVASGDNALNSAINQRGQDMSYAAQQEANQNALYSSLFQGLGSAAGGWLGGVGFNNMMTPG